MCFLNMGKSPKARQDGNDAQRIAVARAHFQQFGQSCPVKAKRAAGIHGILRGSKIGGQQGVVDQLGALPRADIAKMDNQLAKAGKHRLGLGKIWT